MLKRLFLLPELLLLLCMVVVRLYIGNSGIDIHMHDTYFIFSDHPLFGNILFAPLYFMLLLTWLIHLALRKKGLLSARWHWAQVIISLLSLLIFSSFPAAIAYYGLPGRHYEYNTFDTLILGQLFVASCLAVFIICQLLFWIAAAVLVIKQALSR